MCYRYQDVRGETVVWRQGISAIVDLLHGLGLKDKDLQLETVDTIQTGDRLFLSQVCTPSCVRIAFNARTAGGWLFLRSRPPTVPVLQILSANIPDIRVGERSSHHLVIDFPALT